MILDNSAAHQHPNVGKWLALHPRWVFHFTPTSCSWLNADRGLLRQADPAAPQTRRVALARCPPGGDQRFIEHHNQAPRPFTWKADPKTIIAAAKRGHQTLETIH